jgi:hypothetical protein
MDTGYLSTALSKIGYSHGTRRNDNFNSRYCLIDMSDGLIKEGYFTNTKNIDGSHNQNHSSWIWNEFAGENNYEAKQKLCEYLNNNYHKETFRFATNEELVRVANYQKWRTK